MATPLIQTTKEVISEHGFKVVAWVGVTICVVVCIMRLCIRFLCFRRLLGEDYLMVVAAAILIAIGVLIELFIGDVYLMQHVQNRLVDPGPDFFDRMLDGLRAHGIIVILHIVGLWLIKLNFMMLFYRLGSRIRAYLILWWVALVVVIGCGAVNIALIPHDCDFGGLIHIISTCSQESRVKNIYIKYIVTVVVDVFSDLIIICFPIFIVWHTGISRSQKLVLSSVFLLVSFTIAVTIVRGSIFGGTYKAVSKSNRHVIDSSWIIFWFLIEYIVAFTIACLISFRSLWSGERKQNSKNRRERGGNLAGVTIGQSPAGSGGSNSMRKKWRGMYDDLVETLADLEDTTIDHNGSSWLTLPPHLATIDLDFTSSSKRYSAETVVNDSRELGKA